MSKIFPHGVKDLKISGPSTAGQVNCKLKSNIIVVAKYDFAAESVTELTIKKGDVLKLLDKIGNGWVLVKFIDKLIAPGLVPSLYVDIAVNDPNNPITEKWLHEVGNSKSDKDYKNSFADAQVKSLLENNSPVTINNKPYPISASITNFLMYENRYWYRLDITYSTGERAYLCRYYQDFYDLHVSLLDALHNSEPKDASGESLKLPRLPEPIPSNNRNSTDLSALLLQRCKDLHEYVNQLILNKHYQICSPLVLWLDTNYNDVPGLIVPEPLNESNVDINERVLPGSVSVTPTPKQQAGDSPKFEIRRGNTIQRSNTVGGRENTKNTQPAVPGLQRSKTKNTYNHYQQIGAFTLNPPGGAKRSLSTREPTRVLSTSQRKQSSQEDIARSQSIHTVKTSGSMSANASPTSFNQTEAPKTPQLQLAQIRCTIKTQSNDLVNVRVNKPEVSSVDEFKRLVKEKVAFKNLYIKLPNSESFHEVDTPDVDVLGYLRATDNVHLLIT